MSEVVDTLPMSALYVLDHKMSELRQELRHSRSARTTQQQVTTLFAYGRHGFNHILIYTNKTVKKTLKNKRTILLNVI